MTDSDNMPDAEAFRRLAQLGITDPALRRWLGKKQLECARARLDPRVFAYAGRRHEYLLGAASEPVPWCSKGAGARALAFAALNPGRWVPLGHRRSVRAWHAAVHDALEAIARVDLATANLLASASRRSGPGLHLRRCPDGSVEAQWCSPPNVALVVATP